MTKFYFLNQQNPLSELTVTFSNQKPGVVVFNNTTTNPRPLQFHSIHTILLTQWYHHSMIAGRFHRLTVISYFTPLFQFDNIDGTKFTCQANDNMRDHTTYHNTNEAKCCNTDRSDGH